VLLLAGEPNTDHFDGTMGERFGRDWEFLRHRILRRANESRNRYNDCSRRDDRFYSAARSTGKASRIQQLFGISDESHRRMIWAAFK
jgi:hypothetical protein